MLTFPSGVHLFAAAKPTDRRKAFDGLSSLVQGSFECEPTSGDLFIFLNRRSTQVWILFWDRDGFCILMKRLESGTFRRVKTSGGATHVESDAGELGMLLESINAPIVRRQKRYKMPKDDNINGGD
jgi:transposase